MYCTHCQKEKVIMRVKWRVKQKALRLWMGKRDYRERFWACRMNQTVKHWRNKKKTQRVSR